MNSATSAVTKLTTNTMSKPHKILIHLNDAQRHVIQVWLRNNAGRPDPEAYAFADGAVTKIATSKKPLPKNIPYTARCHEPGEVSPVTPFHALRDLPSGWALAPLYDSGNSHAICNAGSAMLCRIWNAWSSRAVGPFTPIPDSSLEAQLKANKITT